jgi:hypothetical protein
MKWTRTTPLIILAAVAANASAQPAFVNSIEVPGNAVDLSTGSGANQNRLGMFSDMFYDRQNHAMYSLADRGPGGGLYPYEARVHKFKVNVNNKTGEISHFRLQETIKFKTADGLSSFNGQNPFLLNGDTSILGLSFDPEGFTIGSNGAIYVADEYGPSVYEFARVELSDGTVEARFVRAFTPPANLLPYAGLLLNFLDGRGVLTSGRQDNRGYEGLTITPDGSKLFAVLQDPLIDEGPTPGEGRRSRNVRIVEYDIATGLSQRQFVYQLETLADINARIPGTANDFGATAQGRNIGCSAILAINSNEFLILERDNRGRGVEDALASLPVGSKRLFRISINGATDVSSRSLFGFATTLPADVTPVSKNLFLDIAAAFQSKGLIIPEKFEALAIGPQLKDGSFTILCGNDNDFSVTQTGAGAQLDVYTDGTSGPMDGDAMGRSLMPTVFAAFKGWISGFIAPAK